MMGFKEPLILVIALPALYLWWRLGRGTKEVRYLRAALVLLLILMAASPYFFTGKAHRHVVLLLDKSLSCGRESVKASEEWNRMLMEKLSPEDRITRIAFGHGASALAREGSVSDLAGSELDDASDLTAGLALANALLQGGQGGRILLVSDGLYTGTDPMDQVPAMIKSDVSVDYVPILAEETLDCAVTGVHLPERVQQGHPFEITFFIHAPEASRAALRILREDQVLRKDVELKAGENRFTFNDTAGPAGLMKYRISVRVEDDMRPENNTALAVNQSVGPPRILVINRGEATNLTRALESAGLSVEVRGPENPILSADLKPYSAVVLENIAMSALCDRADYALRNFVEETGGGLLVTGGRRSFAEGGYYQSRLEDILPVSMLRQEKYSRPRVAMCIVLDRSGSMSAGVGGGLCKMDLANRAAAEAIGVLMPQDEVAVIAVDSSDHVVVPLTRLGEDRGDVLKKVLSIESMGGGIFVYTGLKSAVYELMDIDAPTRHIALFADAADSEEPGEYKALTAEWTGAGGTISVIGLGSDSDSDAAFLMDLAARGNGSVFFTQDPNALPRIFCEDAIRYARKTFLEKATQASVSPQIHRIGKLGIQSFPEVGGYNLCYTKKDAAQLITALDENAAPLLAVWQSGLGRTAAFTCEADGKYTGDLRAWSEYKSFFSSLVKWLERDRDDLALFGTIVRAGRTGTVKLEMDEKAAGECTGAAAIIIPPGDGEPMKLPLRWIASNRMEGAFKLEETGVYHGVILTREGRRVSLPPVILPYSPEFDPKAPSMGLEIMDELAKATKGTRVLHVRDMLERRAGKSREQRSAAPLLAAALLVIFLCDIITRKHLWGHLVPGFARTGYGRVRKGFVSAAKRMKWTPRRREKGMEEEPPLEGPAPEPEPGISVFEKAKRRSRMGKNK